MQQESQELNLINIKEKKYKEIQMEKNDWSNILLGNQFLKSYFVKMGISNSLIVDRIVKIEDFYYNKSIEKIQFIIVRSKYSEKNNHNYKRSDYKNYEKIYQENNFLFFVKKNFFSFKSFNHI
jgi:hypothetical protein